MSVPKQVYYGRARVHRGIGAHTYQIRINPERSDRTIGLMALDGRRVAIVSEDLLTELLACWERDDA